MEDAGDGLLDEERQGRVLGLMSFFEKEELKRELEAEIDRFKAKSAVAEAELVAINQGMEKSLAERDAVIKAKAGITKKLRKETEALEIRVALEKDRLEAALASKYAKVTGILMDRDAEVRSLRDEIAALHDFQTRKADIQIEIRNVEDEHRASTERYESRRLELRTTMDENAARYEREIKSREIASFAKLQAKVEQDMSARYHVVQTEHARMRAELAYQDQRIKVLQAENSALKKRQLSLSAACSREQRHQETISQSIQFHARQKK